MAMDKEELDMHPSQYKPRLATSQPELLEIFDKSVAAAREKIAAASDEHWNGIWTFKVNGKTMMAMPRTAVVRA